MDDNKKSGALDGTHRIRLEAGLIEARYTGQGEPYQVVRDGIDAGEYAALAKAVLGSANDIAHDFKRRVISGSGDGEAFFD